MVVIGIDGRAAPREIGDDHDAVLLQAESPALRVVAGRRERREANQFAHQKGTVAARIRKRPSQGPSDVLLAGLRRTCAQCRQLGARSQAAHDDVSAHQTVDLFAG